MGLLDVNDDGGGGWSERGGGGAGGGGGGAGADGGRPIGGADFEALGGDSKVLALEPP
mgnify:CR=1 FL=1